MRINKFLAGFFVFIIFCNQLTLAEEIIYNENSIDLQAAKTSTESKYPDYSKMYLGEDKHENFNRKMFNLNTKLNKCIAKPVHIIWS